MRSCSASEVEMGAPRRRVYITYSFRGFFGFRPPDETREITAEEANHPERFQTRAATSFTIWEQYEMLVQVNGTSRMFKDDKKVIYSV